MSIPDKMHPASRLLDHPDHRSGTLPARNVMRINPPTPSAEGLEEMNRIKALAEDLHGLVDGLGSCREFSVAKTKIEEAVMWAVKGIAIRDEKDQTHG